MSYARHSGNSELVETVIVRVLGDGLATQLLIALLAPFMLLIPGDWRALGESDWKHQHL